MPKPLADMIANLPPRDQRKVKRRARQLIVAELREIRKRHEVTQQQLAKVLGITQESVSEFETRHDWKVSKLIDYVRALGGSVEIKITTERGSFVLPVT